jgi:hypothetical protein
MKLTAVTSITNNIVAARFWMAIALICGALAVTSPYLTIRAMKQKEKVVILDQGGTLIYSPLLGFEEAAGLQASDLSSKTRGGAFYCGSGLWLWGASKSSGD